MPEVVHLAAEDRGTTVCCNRVPIELPRTDRLTVDPALVTCEHYLGSPYAQPLTFQTELRILLNKHSIEAASSTPDYILASFLLACLSAFEGSVVARDEWWGHKPTIGQGFDG